MTIKNMMQPEVITINEELRLRKYDGNHSFAGPLVTLLFGRRTYL